MISQIDQRSSKGKPAQAMGEKAQAMVEFALTFPIVLVLVLGLIEGGWLMFVYTSLTAAGREAARYGAGVGSLGSGTILYNDCAGIKAAAIRIGHYAGIQTSDIHIYKNTAVTANEYCTGNPPSTTSFVPDDRIIVAININYKPITPLGLLPSFPLHSQNAHTIMLGANVVALPQVFPTEGQTCDVSKYTVVSESNMLGPTDTIVIQNASGTDTSIVNVLIVWDTTSGPRLQSIKDSNGITNLNSLDGAGPSYSWIPSPLMSFPFYDLTLTPPPTPNPNPSFTLNFSSKLKSNVIIRLTLTNGCVFGQ